MIERSWRIPVLERGVLSPWDVGLPDSVCLSSPKQVVASSKPNFSPHFLQIHCNRLGPKTVTLQYIYIRVEFGLSITKTHTQLEPVSSLIFKIFFNVVFLGVYFNVV